MSLSVFEYLNKLGETKIDFQFERSVQLNSLIYKKLPVITVCGTNGKGSTSMFLEKILLESGYNVGTYTSPHLEQINERIRIQGHSISDEEMNRYFHSFLKKVESRNITPTYFEFLTFLALHIFENTDVDIGLFEVGLGGRLDSVHAIPRVGAIMTPISMDHMSYLGDSLVKIAGEKIPVLQQSPFSVVSKQTPEVEEFVVSHLKKLFQMEGQDFHHSGNADMFVYENENLGIGPVKLGLRGDHQTSNAACAVTMALLLHKKSWDKIRTNHILQGLTLVENPGRIEKWMNAKNQELWLDVAHNEDSIDKLVQYFYLRKQNDFHIVFGCSNDKPFEGMIERLKPIAKQFHFVSTPSERSWNPKDLRLEDPLSSVSTLIEQKQFPLLCTGSFYHVGEIRKHLPTWGFTKSR